MNMKLRNDLRAAKNRVERLTHAVGWNSAGIQIYGKELDAAKDEFHRLRVQAIDKQIGELQAAKEKLVKEHNAEVEGRHVTN